MKLAKPINHIAILLDSSGSMRTLATETIAQYNRQAEVMNQHDKQTGQETRLSLYTFASQAHQPVLVDVPLGLVSLKPLTNETYQPDGNTAMLDSIDLAVRQLSQFSRDGDESFLMIVITDGEENYSKQATWTSVAKIVQEKIASDVWTFAFLVPRGHQDVLLGRLPIHAGCVQEWDQTSAGVVQASKATTDGLGAYYQARSAGLRSVKSFFTTNVGPQQAREIPVVCEDWTSKFKVGMNGQICRRIDEFCQSQWGQYEAGRGYYELIKPEIIQAGKDVVVQARHAGFIYGGQYTRAALGLPTESVKVHPGDHKNYRIFIQSTSVNRKLMPGQGVLYRVR